MNKRAIEKSKSEWTRQRILLLEILSHNQNSELQTLRNQLVITVEKRAVQLYRQDWVNEKRRCVDDATTNYRQHIQYGQLMGYL